METGVQSICNGIGCDAFPQLTWRAGDMLPLNFPCGAHRGKMVVSAAAAAIEIGPVHGSHGDEESQGLLQPSTPTSSSLPQQGSVGFSSYLVNISAAGSKRRHVHQFYERQNSLIEGMMEAEALHRGEYEGDKEDELEEARTQRALNLSFASNIALLAIRLAVALLSGSLSLLVTTFDAVLDVISGAIIWTTSRSSKKPDKYKYPIGKGRMQPLGIIVFSSIMGTAGLSIIVEGVSQITGHHGVDSASAPMPVIVGSAIAVIIMKGLMWLVCRRSTNSAVQAFAMDHANDVIVNAAGLVGALLGKYVLWWLDPACAITMALWLIWAWGNQAYEHLVGLVGMSAPPDVLQKITYVVFQHAPGDIKQVDTVRAYSFGCEQWLVEVDIVLPAEMPLQQAHDIGEALQVKLERLPEVARAFVHLDYESAHHPGIEHKEL